MTKLIFFLAILLTSCASQKVIFDKDAQPPIVHSYKKTQSFFLWGLLQTQKSSPIYICDDIENIYSIETRKDVDNVFGNIITGGIAQLHIYNPRKSLIYCKKG